MLERYSYLWGEELNGGTRKSTYFLNGIRKFLNILVDFGKLEHDRTRKLCILEDGIWQSSKLADTDIALNGKVTLYQGLINILVPKSDQ